MTVFLPLAENPRARRHHKCCECGRTICPGETYALDKGHTDGRWWSSTTCVQCDALWWWCMLEFQIYPEEAIHGELLLAVEEAPLRLQAGFRSRWAPGGRLLPFTHRVFGVGHAARVGDTRAVVA